jgi:hypothetical protein
MVYRRYFKVSKVLDVDILGFEIKLFWLFGSFGHFSQKLFNFLAILVLEQNRAMKEPPKNVFAPKIFERSIKFTFHV